jgi:hypothetical protein
MGLVVINLPLLLTGALKLLFDGSQPEWRQFCKLCYAL